MSAHASRRRKPMWSQRSSGPEAAATVSLRSAAPAYGTVLATADVGGRIIEYRHCGPTSIWCKDAGGKGDVGVITWAAGQTPSLRIAATDRLTANPQGAEAELVVRCGMAAWRHLFAGAPLDPTLPIMISRRGPAAAPSRDRKEAAGAGR